MNNYSDLNVQCFREQRRRDVEEKSFEAISLNKKIKKRNLKINEMKKIRAQNFIKEFKLKIHLFMHFHMLFGLSKQSHAESL